MAGFRYWCEAGVDRHLLSGTWQNPTVVGPNHPGVLGRRGDSQEIPRPRGAGAQIILPRRKEKWLLHPTVLHTDG